TYALLKTQFSQPCPQPISLIVNHASDSAVAADVHRRVDRSCQRFLGLSIAFAGAVPYDPQGAGHQTIAMLAGPTGPLALAVAALCRRIVQAPVPFQQRAARA